MWRTVSCTAPLKTEGGDGNYYVGRYGAATTSSIPLHARTQCRVIRTAFSLPPSLSHNLSHWLGFPTVAVLNRFTQHLCIALIPDSFRAVSQSEKVWQVRCNVRGHGCDVTWIRSPTYSISSLFKAQLSYVIPDNNLTALQLSMGPYLLSKALRKSDDRSISWRKVAHCIEKDNRGLEEMEEHPHTSFRDTLFRKTCRWSDNPLSK